MAADKSAERTTEGIHGESGRIYSMSLDKGQALRLQVRDPAGEAGARNAGGAIAGHCVSAVCGRGPGAALLCPDREAGRDPHRAGSACLQPEPASSWPRRECRRTIMPSGPPSWWTCGRTGPSCSSCHSGAGQAQPVYELTTYANEHYERRNCQCSELRSSSCPCAALAWTGDTWGSITRATIKANADLMIDSTWVPKNTFTNWEYGSSYLHVHQRGHLHGRGVQPEQSAGELVGVQQLCHQHQRRQRQLRQRLLGLCEHLLETAGSQGDRTGSRVNWAPIGSVSETLARRPPLP